MKSLSSEARDVLKRIAVSFAVQPFAAEQVERIRPVTLSRLELQRALRELHQTGLLELRQQIWGDKLYRIPQQRFAQIQQDFFTLLAQPEEMGTVTIQEEAVEGLAGQLFRTLVYIAREGLPLTAKGIIHKKQVDRLAEQLTLQERHLHRIFPSASTEASRPYPLSVMVLLDLMLSLGLVNRSKSAYELDFAVLQSWLQLSETKMTSILFKQILSRYENPDPAGQHFRYGIVAPVFTPGSWYALPGIIDGMRSAGLVRENEVEEWRGSILAWLHCLNGFGWCELGSTLEGESCFRWTSAKPSLKQHEGESNDNINGSAGIKDEFIWPIPSAKFIVQPDFEVLVPPEVPFTIRWTLAGCAELLYSDDYWSFRLSRKMLESAAGQGLIPEEIITWIEGHAMTGLPEQVEFSMRQWAKGIGRTSLSEVTLLTCRTESDGEDIAAHPRLQGCLIRIGATHFIVAAEHVDQVRQELTAAGMAPPRSMKGRNGDDEKYSPFSPSHQAEPAARYTVPVDKAFPNLLAGGGTHQQLRLVPADDEEEFFPFGEDIPQMWLREWRRYHISTAEKVMETALNLGAKVRLSLQGQTCDFIPERTSAKPWKVSGHLLHEDKGAAEEVSLTAGDWEEMKLLIPGLQRNSSSAGASGYGMIR